MEQFTPKAKRKHERGRIQQLPHAYWVGYLAQSLFKISRASSLIEARKIARDGLQKVGDPLLGPHEFDEETRKKWRAEVRKPDDE